MALSCRFPAAFKPPHLGTHVSDLLTLFWCLYRKCAASHPSLNDYESPNHRLQDGRATVPQNCCGDCQAPGKLGVLKSGGGTAAETARKSSFSVHVRARPVFRAVSAAVPQRFPQHPDLPTSLPSDRRGNFGEFQLVHGAVLKTLRHSELLRRSVFTTPPRILYLLRGEMPVKPRK